MKLSLNSSHNLDINSLVDSLRQASGITKNTNGFNRYATYESEEDLEQKKLEWEIDGYRVEADTQNSVVYCQDTVEVPVRNIPNFNKIKRHGSLMFETSEVIEGKKIPVYWNLKQAENKELILVQSKQEKSLPVNYSKIRLAGTEVREFLQYCPIAKQLDILEDKNNYYLDKNIDSNRLQQDIISAGFDVILIKED